MRLDDIRTGCGFFLTGALALALCLSCSGELDDAEMTTDDGTGGGQDSAGDSATATDAGGDSGADTETADSASQLSRWSVMKDDEIRDVLAKDTEACADKKDGSPCTTTLFSAPFCSAWGSVFRTTGFCAGDEHQPLSCYVESIRCASEDYVLSCDEDEQGGELLMIARSKCESGDGQEAHCARQEPVVAQRCNERIGDRLCHDIEEATATKQLNDLYSIASGQLYEVSSVKCGQGKYRLECIPQTSVQVTDCDAEGDYCTGNRGEEYIETLPDGAQIDDVKNHSWFAIEYTASSNASCETPPPCYNKTIGDSCETGVQASCSGNKLIEAQGTCDIPEMTLVCMANHVDCGDKKCVEADNSASCQEIILVP